MSRMFGYAASLGVAAIGVNKVLRDALIDATAQALRKDAAEFMREQVEASKASDASSRELHAQMIEEIGLLMTSSQTRATPPPIEQHTQALQQVNQAQAQQQVQQQVQQQAPQQQQPQQQQPVQTPGTPTMMR